MDIFTYERPREKLRSRGASYLSLGELFQIIIGSGSATVSAARLARHLVQLSSQGVFAYKDLVAINGLGTAKACQVLAAIELGRRFAQRSGKGLPRETASITVDALKAAARSMRPPALICYWLGGDGAAVDYKVYHMDRSTHTRVLVQNIFTDALAASARSILVGIVLQRSQLQPNTTQLGMLQALNDTARIVQIRLIDVYALYKGHATRWSDEI